MRRVFLRPSATQEREEGFGTNGGSVGVALWASPVIHPAGSY